VEHSGSSLVETGQVLLEEQMAKGSIERRPTMMRTPRGGRPDLVSDALRQLWASAEDDPVPDDFLQLLDRLDAARAAAGSRPAEQTEKPPASDEDEPTA
jgi:hypothetical protein